MAPEGGVDPHTHPWVRSVFKTGQRAAAESSGMVGRVGVEPTTSEESRFTVCRVCRFATYPNIGL